MANIFTLRRRPHEIFRYARAPWPAFRPAMAQAFRRQIAPAIRRGLPKKSGRLQRSLRIRSGPANRLAIVQTAAHGRYVGARGIAARETERRQRTAIKTAAFQVIIRGE